MAELGDDPVWRLSNSQCHKRPIVQNHRRANDERPRSVFPRISRPFWTRQQSGHFGPHRAFKSRGFLSPCVVADLDFQLAAASRVRWHIQTIRLCSHRPSAHACPTGLGLACCVTDKAILGTGVRSTARKAVVAALTLGLAAPLHADPPPLSTYGQLPGFEMAAVSSSGRHLAVLGRVGETRILLILDAQGSLLFKTKIDNAKISRLEWAGDSSVLVTSHNVEHLGVGWIADKMDLQGVVAIPIDGTPAWRILDNPRLTTGGIVGAYGLAERDGHYFGYFGSLAIQYGGEGIAYLPPGTQHPDLFEVDLVTRKARDIYKRPEGDHDDRDWLIDAHGQVASVLDRDRRTGRWSIYNHANDKLVSGVAPLGGVHMFAFTADGSGLIWHQRDEDQDQWYSVSLAGGPPQPFLAGVSFSQLVRDKHNHVIGYIDDTPVAGAHYFDPHQSDVYRAIQKAFKNSQITLIDANDAFDHLLVTTEGPGDPGTWWFVDVANLKAVPIGTSYPMPPEAVGSMKMVAFTAADGTKIEGVLTLPPGREAKHLPAVMLPHGGPAARDRVRFDWLAQALASRGYAVFQPNFRGSTGYGATFEQAGHGEWGRKMQSDISDGLAELVRQGLVDPKRVCIAGASYGGYAALAGVTLQNGIYRCAVSIAGISDLNAMIYDDVRESGNDPLLTRALKAEVGSGKDLKSVSPIRFVNKVNVPVLLIHGKDDTVVDYRQSARMNDELRKAGKASTLVTIPGGDHWLSTSETRMATLQATVDFLLRNNPPDGVN